jgi:hypothetical protein
MKTTAVELYHMLRKRPFQPFRLHLTDGSYYDIRFPELNVSCVDFFVVGIPVSNDPDPFAERTIEVPLTAIERVELIETPSMAR